MKTVVMAEDDAATRDLVADALAELEGCVVRAVADGAALLTMLQTVCPDVSILDVNMPGLKGPEVYRLIRERDEVRDVPVLFMSAQGRQAVAGLAGAYQWLAKPLDVNDLLRLVGAMVDRAVPEAIESAHQRTPTGQPQ